MSETTDTPRLQPLDELRCAAECLKVMAHPIRLRIVEILMQGEFPVREIARLCELSANQTCEHLRLMQGRGLLDSRRDGRTVLYRITSPRLPRLLGCIQEHCGENQSENQSEGTENE